MKRVVLVVVICFMLVNPLFAKNTKHRKKLAKQKQRIEQGIKSGQLTEEEANVLAAEQKKLQQMKEDIRSDQVVTPEERQKIKEATKEASQHIYDEKHDLETRN